MSAVAVGLRALRLPTMAREHAAAVERAERENWGYERLLAYLVEAELAERSRRAVDRRLQESGLPSGKSLADLDPALLPDKVRRLLPTLAGGDLVRRGDNLLCFGLPGVGKSHACAALGREWIERQGLRVLFTPAFRLVGQLLVAKRDLKLAATIKAMDRFDAVVLDDLGYVKQGPDEMEVLFTFLAERYEKRTVVITSNLVFSQWDRIFRDPMTAMAAVDRLVHHATILEFGGESYRARAAREAAQ